MAETPEHNLPSAPERLVALGQVAGDLMRDMATLLQVVHTHASGALLDSRRGSMPVRELQQLNGACDELGAMLRDAMETLKGAALSPEVVFNPVAVAERVIAQPSERLAGIEARLTSSLPPGIVVKGRASFFSRALRNVIQIVAATAESGVRVSFDLPRSPDIDSQLEIVVEGDGPDAVNNAVVQWLEPQISAQKSDEGSYLSSVLWAIRQLGGSVRRRFDGNVSGPHFEIRLPVANSPASLSTPPPPTLEGRRLLLLEDDALVRDALRRLLGKLGAEVSEADPLEINDDDLVRASLSSTPDAVLMDIKLGDRMGVDLWHVLHASVPALARQVIFLSGLAPGDPEWEAACATGQPVLGKPVDLEQLAAAIRDVTATP